jgi:hypothetical protein
MDICILLVLERRKVEIVDSKESIVRAIPLAGFFLSRFDVFKDSYGHGVGFPFGVNPAKLPMDQGRPLSPVLIPHRDVSVGHDSSPSVESEYARTRDIATIKFCFISQITLDKVGDSGVKSAPDSAKKPYKTIG